MKTLIAALALSCISTIAYSDPYSRNDRPSANIREKGIETYNPELDARERVGVGCSLYIDDNLEHKGYCKVGRRDSVTLISTGTTTYKLVRDSREEARFYEGVNSNISYGTVFASSGGCWRGNRVRFCAN